LVNLNIGLFPNVDVVADAYSLPYADGAVDAIFCEAVLEHLEFPEVAVREMFRVLRAGGQVFAATPFLYAYHGYPNQFQNFTRPGHERLFSRNGFRVVSSGVCVGPSYMISDMLYKYVNTFTKSVVLRKLMSKSLTVFYLVFRRRDRRLNRHPAAEGMASTTYIHAQKP
jgi:ubiquinone/menaquinone biosynthesis C-methylase UbiE